MRFYFSRNLLLGCSSNFDGFAGGFEINQFLVSTIKVYHLSVFMAGQRFDGIGRQSAFFGKCDKGVPKTMKGQFSPFALHFRNSNFLHGPEEASADTLIKHRSISAIFVE